MKFQVINKVATFSGYFEVFGNISKMHNDSEYFELFFNSGSLMIVFCLTRDSYKISGQFFLQLK